MERRLYELDEQRAITADGIGRGVTIHSIATAEWNVANDCLKPIRFTREARKNPDHPDQAKAETNNQAHYLDMVMPCRQCERCLEHRRKHWLNLAHTEFEQSLRTWFVTLTINENMRTAWLEDPRYLEAMQGLVEFSPWHMEQPLLSKEITKYLKRLRKAKHRFKYLCVFEAHKSGVPHAHMLIFERSKITYRQLETHWHGSTSDEKRGFGKWKIAETPAELYYTTKYLTKDFAARLRASQGFGIPEFILPPSGGSGGETVSTNSEQRDTSPTTPPSPLPAAAGEETSPDVEEGGHS